MIIALDYDGTFTEHVNLWVHFINVCRRQNITVIGVTMRYEHEKEDMNKLYLYNVSRTIFTGRKAKKSFVESLGIKVDIWIDDRPDFILQDASS